MPSIHKQKKTLENMIVEPDNLNNGWINVKVRLPELNEPLIGYNDKNIKQILIENYEANVLGYNVELGIFKARLTKMGWCEVSSISTSVVKPLYWIPLPEPPIVVNESSAEDNYFDEEFK